MLELIRLGGARQVERQIKAASRLARLHYCHPRVTVPHIESVLLHNAVAEPPWWCAGFGVERVPGSICNDALGVDRIALMFLMRGEAYHDVLWRRWLDSAAGLVPAQALQARERGVWPLCLWSPRCSSTSAHVWVR